MFKQSIVAALVLGLCSVASAAKPQATAKGGTKISAAAAKSAYLNAINNNTYNLFHKFVPLSGKALAAYKAQKKATGGEFTPQIVSLSGKGKIAAGTIGIFLQSESQLMLSVVKRNKAGGASTVIGSYSINDE